jgi:D-sedoheptulose 7-phosphate isomerase
MMPDTGTASAQVAAYLLRSAELKREVAGQCIDSILTAAGHIVKTFKAGGKLLLCGNGGSAADCQHMAAEFVGRMAGTAEPEGLAAVALTTDTSFMTAFANDYGFDAVFERQVRALGRAGDALLGISTSGSSRNVIRAVEAARAAGLHTIALTGNGGPLKTLADVAISVPSANTQHVQEAHLAIEHILVALVEWQLLGRSSTWGERR